jgi:hypothetical protein
MEKAMLRLFNAVQVVSKDVDQKADVDLLKHTVKNGYILDSAIKPTASLLNIIESVVGISGEKANAAFHKSWTVIQDTPQEALWMQAIIHYMTTYGFEALGIYSEATVYIPHEKLELPEVKEDIPLTVVKAMTAEEILDGIVRLGSSGIALMQETLDDIMMIVIGNKYEPVFVEQIKNRELKALLYDHYKIVPQEPVEFLRHLVSKLTDESLLIKNKYLIEKIKASNGKFLDELLTQAPDDLASIFFRFKPLFLAMKSISKNKTFFNRLRKQAETLHKPLPEDYLNNVTARIKNGTLDLKKLQYKLESASIFRKIRLAYALKFREDAGDSIVYRIRNGRGWATDFEWESNTTDTTEVLDLVVTSIAVDLSESVKGKTILIPENVHYALPATEKQFTGFLPTGSYVSVPEDMIFGIHWFNTSKRVDLDLSTISVSGKTGWDSVYKSEGNTVLFSGDITDAPKPKGASELFYIKGTAAQEDKVLLLNYYNFTSGDGVETKLLVASEKAENFGNNYMVDVGNIIASANLNITKKQNVLGLATSVNGENRFYFANVSIGKAITSRMDAQTTHARNFLVSRLVNSLDFREILTRAGATCVSEKPEDEEFVDLSPTVLDKTTFIDLLCGEELLNG